MTPANQVFGPAKKKSPLLAFLLATGWGAGYLPLAPGTWGSLQGLGLFWLAYWASPDHFKALAGIFLILAMYPAVRASGGIARSRDQEDPSEIVVDETLGQMLCLLWVPAAWGWHLAAFLLFRLFDIAKPFPVNRSEKLPGGMGIVADDLVAGLYAGCTLKVAHYYLAS